MNPLNLAEDLKKEIDSFEKYYQNGKENKYMWKEPHVIELVNQAKALLQAFQMEVEFLSSMLPFERNLYINMRKERLQNLQSAINELNKIIGGENVKKT